MTFAKQLQAARAAAGLSQSQAALAIGRSVRTLQAWEQAVNVPHPTIQAAALSAVKSAKPPKKQAENGQSAGTAD
jgi:DNA-binding transcriptional regulator YiaG